MHGSFPTYKRCCTGAASQEMARPARGSKEMRVRRMNVRRAMWMVLAGVLAISQTGCMAVGYSSGGGWFVWPGGLGLLVIVLLIIFLLRRR